jgi:hypothetical protein
LAKPPVIAHNDAVSAMKVGRENLVVMVRTRFSFVGVVLRLLLVVILVVMVHRAVIHFAIVHLWAI